MSAFDELDDDALIERVRADVVAERVHFNHAGMSLTPTPALERMHTYLDREAAIGGYEAAAEAAERLAGVPAAVAPLFGPTVDADEVTIVESATRGWETVLWAMAETFGYGPGDRLLIDGFTYATTYVTIERLRAAHGVTVDVVPSTADATVDLDQLAARLDPATRLVAITHMPTHLGTRTDAAAVGRLLAGTGVVFALDVAQTMGQMPVDVAAAGCSIAFAPGRKFVRGPRGTGALYVEAALADQLVPLSPPFGSVTPARPGVFDLTRGARRFDAFEYGHAARLGLAEAARYAMAIGLDRIERLVAARSHEVTELLASTDGVRLLAGPEAVGIISFVHDRLDPAEVRARLGSAGVNVWVNPAEGTPIDGHDRPVLPSVRVSPHYLTDVADLAALGAALDQL